MSAIRIAVVSVLTVVALLGGTASTRHHTAVHPHTLAGPITCCDIATI